MGARKPRAYRTCTFQGLGNKRQAYLDSVAERMAEQGFKRAEEWRERNPVFDGSNSIFKSSDEKFLVAIRAISTEDGNLRAGFSLAGVPGKAAKIFVFSIGFAFILGALSAYILRQMFGPIKGTVQDLWMLILVMIILFTAFGFPVLAYMTPSKMRYNRKVRQILVETAESMGSKQITPFSSYLKSTTVDLED